MANFKGHLRAGFRFYAVFLIIAVVLWVVRDWLPFDSSIQFIPVSETASGVVVDLSLCLALAIVGALFPDLDTKSKPQMLFYRVFFVADILLLVAYHTRGDLIYLQAAAYFGLAVMAPLLGNHRGWTHWRTTMILLPSPLLLLPMLAKGDVVWVGLPFYAAAVVGYASHLYKDGLLLRI